MSDPDPNKQCGHVEPWVTLRRLRDIVVAEFSYDGDDPRGVKAYQAEVDAADALLEKARSRCP